MKQGEKRKFENKARNLKKGEISEWGKNGEGLERREENGERLKMRQKMWGWKRRQYKAYLLLEFEIFL